MIIDPLSKLEREVYEIYQNAPDDFVAFANVVCLIKSYVRNAATVATNHGASDAASSILELLN